jgi:predicted enzyme related to lactoylglutathione lyase
MWVAFGSHQLTMTDPISQMSEKPTHGEPCWIQITAQDVDRATDFYKSILDFTITNQREIQGMGKMSLFTFKGKFEEKLSGGILKRCPSYPDPPESGPAVIYFYADDLEGTMDKIVKAGGKKLSDRTPAGDMGYSMDFRDTEGNFHGLYTSKKE